MYNYTNADYQIAYSSNVSELNVLLDIIFIHILIDLYLHTKAYSYTYPYV